MRVLLVLVAALAVMPAHADQAVAASFIHPSNAEAAAARLAERLGIPARVVPVDIEGRRWYRVIAPSADPARTVAELRAAGFEDAWLLPGASPPPANERPAQASPPAPAESRVATPHAQAATPIVRAMTRESAGQAELIEVLEGIPTHRVRLPFHEDAAVGIKLDGKVDEPIWRQTPYYDNMIVAVPGTGKPGKYPTHTRLVATERGLYVSAILYQPPETLVKRMASRDAFIDRDTFGITLDTSGEGLFGYWFTLALGGDQADGKVLPERNYSNDWDGPWIGRTAERSDGWSAEIFLPWSMMSMPRVDGPRTINFGITRSVSHLNERYQWPGHPYSSPRFVSALNAISVEGVQPRQQYSLIPYASDTFDAARHENDVRIGADLSWKPSPKLETTASVLPDFGAVETDDVVINLTAQETFFPEKRLFFLEGIEVFVTHPRANPGNVTRFTTNENFATTARRVFLTTFLPAPISLMNTRRIGGTATQVRLAPGEREDRGERARPTELLGAAKVTGSIGNVRYGLLGALEDDVEWLGRNAAGQRIHISDPGRDFGVARIIYEDVGASRRSIGYIGSYVGGPLYDAYVHGVDAHYTSAGGRWIADALGMASEVDRLNGYGGMFDLAYTASNAITHRFAVDYMDEHIDINDLGFLRRNDFVAAQYTLLYAKNKGFRALKDIRGTLIVRKDFNVSRGQDVDGGVYWRNSMVLPGRNQLRTGIGYMFAGYEDRDSRGNGAFRTNDRFWFEALLSTDASKKLSYSVSLGAFQEELSDWTYTASAGVTIRPANNLALDLDLKLKDRHGWLVYQGGRNFGRYAAIDLQPSVKFDWYLAPRHQLGMRMQWAAVRADERGFFAVPVGDGKLEPAARTLPDHDFTLSLFTMQVRYRFSIAPLTDFFLVYNRGNDLANTNDSGFGSLLTDTFTNPITDSLVAKLRYRFGN